VAYDDTTIPSVLLYLRTEDILMYSRKVCASAWPRCGDRWSRGILPVVGPTNFPFSLSISSSWDGSSLRFGQIQHNQVRCASIRTIFKLWQQQEIVLPIYSKKVKPDPNFDPWAPPASAIPPRGGGGFVSDEAKKRVASFGCSYQRHANDQRKDDEDLDIDAIEALIEERNEAKRERNFEHADAIRDDLKSMHGVYLNDRERTWGTNASIIGGYLGSSPRIPEQFGPTGHDYQLCDDAGPSISPLSDDEIHKLIAERLRCKLNRDFQRADEIKEELVAKDVAIDDSSKMWRADGVRIYFAGGRNKKFDYSYAPDAGPSRATMTDDEVSKLLAERQECRYNRDFDGADSILTDLEDAGVQIDDANRMWRADGKSFGSDGYGNDEDGDGDGYRGGGRGKTFESFVLQFLFWDLIFPLPYFQDEGVVVASVEAVVVAVVGETAMETEVEDTAAIEVIMVGTRTGEEVIAARMVEEGEEVDVDLMEEVDADRMKEVEIEVDIVAAVGVEVGIVMVVVVVAEDVDEDVVVTNHWIHFACLCRCILAVFRRRKNLRIVLNESETVYEGLVALLVTLLYFYRSSGCCVY
jgi:hypothetical protein